MIILWWHKNPYHLVFPKVTKIRLSQDFMIVLRNNKILQLLFSTWEFKTSSMKIYWFFFPPAVEWAPYYAEEPESKCSYEKRGSVLSHVTAEWCQRGAFKWCDNTDLRPRRVHLAEWPLLHHSHGTDPKNIAVWNHRFPWRKYDLNRHI